MHIIYAFSLFCPQSSHNREIWLLKSDQVLDFLCGKFSDPVVTADDFVVQGLLFIKHLVDFSSRVPVQISL